ncbi:MAG: hypothetical protein WCY25_08975 [Moheibacter sp.]
MVAIAEKEFYPYLKNAKYQAMEINEGKLQGCECRLMLMVWLEGFISKKPQEKFPWLH